MNKSRLSRIFMVIALLIAASSFFCTIAVAEKSKGQNTAVININEASEDELAQLTGIGKTKAQAIIAYRTAHGRFASVDDMTNVKGIGKKTLEKIRDRITAR